MSLASSGGLCLEGAGGLIQTAGVFHTRDQDRNSRATRRKQAHQRAMSRREDLQKNSSTGSAKR
jgi:hypothetical protein